MKKCFIFYIILLFAIFSCAVKNKVYQSLEGEVWKYRLNIDKLGVDVDYSWIFLENNQVVEKEYISAGNHLINSYKGTYFYDAETKTVFLEYKLDSNKILKKRLDLTITNQDTIIAIIDNRWKNSFLNNFIREKIMIRK